MTNNNPSQKCKCKSDIHICGKEPQYVCSTCFKQKKKWWFRFGGILTDIYVCRSLCDKDSKYLYDKYIKHIDNYKKYDAAS